jgi:hypothetical protein
MKLLVVVDRSVSAASSVAVFVVRVLRAPGIHPPVKFAVVSRPESFIDASSGTLALGENRQDSRDRRDRADECQRNTNSFPLILVESISQKKCNPCTEHSPRDDDETEFWPSKLDFFHKSKISGYKRKIVSSMHSVNGERS